MQTNLTRALTTGQTDEINGLNYAVCQQAYWVALVENKMLGIRTALKMVLDGFSVQDIWHADEAMMRGYIKQTDKRHYFLQRASQQSVLMQAQTFVKECAAKGVQIVSIDQDEYPPMLREIYDPPLVLYVRGCLKALSGGDNQRTLAVVGTRRISEYGKQVTQKLVAETTAYYPVIISGLAEGVDAEAHRTAIHCHLPTVAVFGCGIDRIFPSFHQKLAMQILEHQGALVSEWPPGYPGDKYTFPKRNRIIAGLSEATLVVEGAIKSGALITARTAFEEGRQVYAVPGNIFNPVSHGPLHLIKNGVTPVSSAEEIAEDLKWKPWGLKCPKPAPKQRVLKEQEINPVQVKATTPLIEGNQSDGVEAVCLYPELLQLIPDDPYSIEALHQACGLNLSQLNEQITMLELEGLVKCLPGQQISRLR